MLRACPGGFWSGPPRTHTPQILPPQRHCWLGRESIPAAWTTSYKSQGGTLGKRATQIQYVNSERFNWRKKKSSVSGFLHKKNEKGLEVVLFTLKITSWHFQQSITAYEKQEISVIRTLKMSEERAEGMYRWIKWLREKRKGGLRPNQTILTLSRNSSPGERHQTLSLTWKIKDTLRWHCSQKRTKLFPLPKTSPSLHLALARKKKSGVWLREVTIWARVISTVTLHGLPCKNTHHVIEAYQCVVWQWAAHKNMRADENRWFCTVSVYGFIFPLAVSLEQVIMGVKSGCWLPLDAPALISSETVC